MRMEFIPMQFASLRRARNENPSRAPDDLNDPDAFSLRLQWCHVPCARGTHFEATTCFTSSKRTLLGSYLSLQEDFISMFSQFQPIVSSLDQFLDQFGSLRSYDCVEVQKARFDFWGLLTSAMVLLYLGASPQRSLHIRSA